MNTEFKKHWGDNGVYNNDKSIWDVFTEKLNRGIKNINKKINDLSNDNDRVNKQGNYKSEHTIHENDNSKNMDKWSEMQEHFGDNGL